MRTKGFAIAMGIGLIVMAIFVGGIVLKQRGSTPRLVGEIVNVRTLGVEPDASVAIVDLNVTNDSKLLFIVQQTGMSVLDSNSLPHEGRIVSASDTDRLFSLFPALGAKTAEVLVIRTASARGIPVRPRWRRASRFRRPSWTPARS